MKIIFKNIIILVLLTNILNADSKAELHNLTLKVKKLEFENQLLKQKVDFLNNNFDTRLKVQHEIFDKNLDHTVLSYKVILEKQNINHLNELDNQFWTFSLFVAFSSILAFLVSWIGSKYIKRKIRKTIKENHTQETEKIVNSLANSTQFIELIRAELDIHSMDETDTENETDDEQLS